MSYLVRVCAGVVEQDTGSRVVASKHDAGAGPYVSVHDELITEAPDSPEFSADHLASLMATNPKWADGLPLAAAGFEAYRYKKD